MSKRIQFFLGHLAISFSIAILIIGIVFFVWFPSPLAHAEGVTRIFLMLLVIDVILGPMLTFLVYKEGKKTLKMDLSVIILIQILALGYGFYSIAQSRPVWIVQAGQVFQLVRANAVIKEEQKDALDAYRSNGWGAPKWVAVDEKRSVGMVEPTVIPNTYTDFAAAKPRIQQYAQSLEKLQQFNEPSDVAEVLKKHPNANAWMPLRTTDLGAVVLVNRDEGSVVKVVNLRPWQE